MEARDDNEDEDVDFETREERAAAAEARELGGPPEELADLAGDEIDPALRPVIEAGGGEGDGFELAEHDLIRNASHDDGTGNPERDAFTPETESDRSTAEYGEADEEIHSDD